MIRYFGGSTCQPWTVCSPGVQPSYGWRGAPQWLCGMIQWIMVVVIALFQGRKVETHLHESKNKPWFFGPWLFTEGSVIRILMSGLRWIAVGGKTSLCTKSHRLEPLQLSLSDKSDYGSWFTWIYFRSCWFCVFHSLFFLFVPFLFIVLLLSSFFLFSSSYSSSLQTVASQGSPTFVLRKIQQL